MQISYMPPPLYMHSSHHYQYHSLDWWVLFFSFFYTKDESTLTHRDPWKSIVYVRVHSWCKFRGFGQMCNDMYCYCLKNSSVLCLFISLSSHHWSPRIFLSSEVSFSRMPYSWNSLKLFIQEQTFTEYLQYSRHYIGYRN